MGPVRERFNDVHTDQFHFTNLHPTAATTVVVFYVLGSGDITTVRFNDDIELV